MSKVLREFKHSDFVHQDLHLSTFLVTVLVGAYFKATVLRSNCLVSPKKDVQNLLAAFFVTTWKKKKKLL